MRRQIIYLVLIVFSLSSISPVALAEKGQGKGKENKVKKEQKIQKRAKEAKEKGPKIKHYGMDANNDGIITRDEWRGNDVSFRNQDWNCDGVLSGDELRPGAKKTRRCKKDEIRFTKGDAREFGILDRNGDGVISRSEWLSDISIFIDLDVNKDGVLTPDEFARVSLLDSLFSRAVSKLKAWVTGLWNKIW